MGDMPGPAAFAHAAMPHCTTDRLNHATRDFAKAFDFFADAFAYAFDNLRSREIRYAARGPG